jgi:hypothetical protein
MIAITVKMKSLKLGPATAIQEILAIMAILAILAILAIHRRLYL